MAETIANLRKWAEQRARLCSVHGTDGLTTIEFSFDNDTVTSGNKPFNSAIYKHVITFPNSRWYQQNSSSIYI